jgi:oligoendopeptidase F
MNTSAYHGPTWDLSTEYASPTCAEIDADITEVLRLLDGVDVLNGQLDGEQSIGAAQSIYRQLTHALDLLDNVSTYARSRLSVDSHDDAAQTLSGRLNNVTKRLAALGEPLSQFTILADNETITAYLDDEHVRPSTFTVMHARKRREHMLSLREEQLAKSLAQDGIHAFGTLYGRLSGTLRCEVVQGNESSEVGLAEAAAMQSSTSTTDRKSAWLAVNTAWEGHEETCAASLNAIAGWRLEMAAQRGAKTQMHFLDEPAHMSRISGETLDVLMEAATQARPLARRAAKLQARAYGETQLGPWDQRAPAPQDPSTDASPGITFTDAINVIANAYAQIDPSMGEFVQMMAQREWIEGSVGPTKRPGAYCTGFAKSRTPRVYMTYTGAVSDVITLAHELGHAYHSWIMRDLHRSQTSYGMSLAETASTFGETLVRNALLERAATPAQKMQVLWQDMDALVTFILNIPTRFTFEKRFYEKRAERPLQPGEFKALMNEAWTECYGDAMVQPDSMFWASKLHFFISGVSFYNFPYLFGYLFSQGIYAKRQAFGDGFFTRFQALLRDTGRMTAEDLAREHLGSDLQAPLFWSDTIDSLALSVDAFESAVNEVVGSQAR